MSRRQKLEADLKSITEECSKNKATMNIHDIKLDDETLYFQYNNGKNKESFVLQISEYPESILFVGSDTRMCTETLPVLIRNLSKEFNTKFKFKPKKQEESEEEEEEEEEYEGSDGEGEEEEKDLMESGGWEQEVLASELSYKENETLTTELANFKRIFGEEKASTRPMPGLDAVDVELKLPISEIIDFSVCNAWGVDPARIVIIKLTFSADYYTDDQSTPKIELYQPGQNGAKDKFKLKYQLESILSTYIKEIWPSTTGKKIRPKTYQSHSAPNKQKKDEKKEQKSFFGRVFSSKDSEQDENLVKLIEMGFSFDQAKNAMQVASTLEEATHLLISDPATYDHPFEENVSNSKQSKGPKLDERDLFQNPNKAYSSNQKKSNVNSDYGFLCMVGFYIRQRLPNLNDYCVICDQPHVFATGNMLKPAVCTRDLCCFSFQQLRVAADAADDIATAAEVVDLLVCFCTVAARSPRSNLILEPFPTVFDPANPKQAILSPNNKNFELVNDILRKFPSVEQMSKSKDFSDMKKKMDQSHKYAYSLLQWIITSNRSHIVKLPSERFIKSMETTHQYLLLSAPPEKEARFRDLKKTHGSIFAFHGSSSENWHSILRRGLVNASGTKLQVNGAAYGNGIYLSPHAGTSFGYCRMYGSGGGGNREGNRFLDNTNINCIAICEVINKDIRKSGSIWVQPNEDYVCTRFFFVYTNTNPGNAQNCSTENTPFVNEILNAMKY